MTIPGPCVRLLCDYSRPLCKEVVEEELEKQEEERRLAQARQEALAAQAKADASQTLAQTLLEETLASEVNSLAQQQMRSVLVIDLHIKVQEILFLCIRVLANILKQGVQKEVS